MLFNSYVFLLVFLPIVFAGWWTLSSKNARLMLLTVASCVFYGWWDWRFVPLMIVSAMADYFAGLIISRTADPRTRLRVLIALLAFNLGLLGFFKYLDFALGTFGALGSVLGIETQVEPLGIILPVGISFYTFNSISYTVDVYRGRVKPAKNGLEFLSFVVMFPHLVAGPIVRYSDMGEQFERLPSKPEPGKLFIGSWFFILGLAKKLFLADPLAASLVDPVFAAPDGVGFVTSWLAALGYTAQLYFDFSAYSDMAVGLAFFLGLRFPQNFDSPYKSENPSEFWRRWHMSLSFWLRDYLFISLGGSRGTAATTARNLAITMFLGGLWHGASWTFVLWGLYHGALLVIHAWARDRGLVPRSRVVSIGLTFLAIVVGWVIFRAASFSDAGAVLAGMLGINGIEAIAALGTIPKTSVLFLCAALSVAFFAPNTWEIRYPRGRMAAVLLVALLVAALLRLEEQSPFLYFQF